MPGSPTPPVTGAPSSASIDQERIHLGFEECNAPALCRRFIRGKGQITVDDKEVVVRFPRRAHNPVLRALDWKQLPDRVSWLGNRRLRFEWK